MSIPSSLNPSSKNHTLEQPTALGGGSRKQRSDPVMSSTSILKENPPPFLSFPFLSFPFPFLPSQKHAKRHRTNK